VAYDKKIEMNPSAMTRIIDAPRLVAGLLALACLTLVLAAGIRILAPIPPIAPLAPRMEAQPDPDRLKTLFGSVGSVSPTVGPAIATDLNIRLVGVIVEGDRSLALIAVNGGPPRALGIGSRLAGDVKLADIDVDRITIERSDGRKSILQVPPRSVSTGASTPSRSTPPIAPASGGAIRR
jgi:general secretion pathway protein C